MNVASDILAFVIALCYIPILEAWEQSNYTVGITKAKSLPVVDHFVWNFDWRVNSIWYTSIIRSPMLTTLAFVLCFVWSPVTLLYGTVRLACTATNKDSFMFPLAILHHRMNASLWCLENHFSSPQLQHWILNLFLWWSSCSVIRNQYLTIMTSSLKTSTKLAFTAPKLRTSIVPWRLLTDGAILVMMSPQCEGKQHFNYYALVWPRHQETYSYTILTSSMTV